jgi:hypothetical protein
MTTHDSTSPRRKSRAHSAKSLKSRKSGFGAGNGSRPTDREMGRTHSYLTAQEVDAMVRAAKRTGRHGHRDSTLILLAYRHG